MKGCEQMGVRRQTVMRREEVLKTQHRENSLSETRRFSAITPRRASPFPHFVLSALSLDFFLTAHHTRTLESQQPYSRHIPAGTPRSAASRWRAGTCTPVSGRSACGRGLQCVAELGVRTTRHRNGSPFRDLHVSAVAWSVSSRTRLLINGSVCVCSTFARG